MILSAIFFLNHLFHRTSTSRKVTDMLTIYKFTLSILTKYLTYSECSLKSISGNKSPQTLTWFLTKNVKWKNQNQLSIQLGHSKLGNQASPSSPVFCLKFDWWKTDYVMFWNNLGPWKWKWLTIVKVNMAD